MQKLISARSDSKEDRRWKGVRLKENIFKLFFFLKREPRSSDNTMGKRRNEALHPELVL